jgi:hypothetical protein
MKRILLIPLLLPLSAEAQFDRLREPWTIKFVPDTLFWFSRVSDSLHDWSRLIDATDIWAANALPGNDTITLDMMTPAVRGMNFIFANIDNRDIADLRGSALESLEGEFIFVLEYVTADGWSHWFVANLMPIGLELMPDGPRDIVFNYFVHADDGLARGFVAKGELFFLYGGLADAGP